MSGQRLKRKASQQLTPNSDQPMLAMSSPAEGDTVRGKIMRALNTSFSRLSTSFSASLSGWNPFAAADVADKSSNAIPAKPRTQESKIRKDSAKALKRQKAQDEGPAIPIPTSDTYNNNGLGVLDVEDCETEIDANRRVQEFWMPKVVGLPRRKSTTFRQPIPTKDLIQDSGGDGCSSNRPPSDRRTPRRSISCGHIRGGEPPVDLIFQEPVDVIRDKDLVEGIKNLLDLNDNAATSKPSEFSQAKRKKAAEQRKIEERHNRARLAKERRLHRRPPRNALIRPLDPDWEDRVLDAMSGNDRLRVIVKTNGNQNLAVHDFLSLSRGTWLNDEIINGYLEWVVDAANKAAVSELKALGEPEPTVPQFIAHNSFFYPDVKSKGPSCTRNRMKRLKAPGVSLLKVDSVFVPICEGSHWTLGVVRPVAKTIEYFDSLRGSSHAFMKHMRAWIECMLGEAYVESEWKELGTPSTKQSNGYDCGVFVCTNALCVALGLDTLCYRGNELDVQRRNIAAVLINRGFKGDFEWTNGSW